MKLQLQGADVEAIRGEFPALSQERVELLARFAGLLRVENQRQNLTRLDQPQDFVFGHLTDCVHLVQQGFVIGRCLDFGSGQGIPGLLCEILSGVPWVVTESERRKGEFLSSAVTALGLRSRVYQGRGEEILKTERVDRVVCRAVGSISNIYGWIRRCSTWNTLVLLKSRGWESEWRAFNQGANRGRLVLVRSYEYHVGLDRKYRLITELRRD